MKIIKGEPAMDQQPEKDNPSFIEELTPKEPQIEALEEPQIDAEGVHAEEEEHDEIVNLNNWFMCNICARPLKFIKGKMFHYASSHRRQYWHICPVSICRDAFATTSKLAVHRNVNHI